MPFCPPRQREPIAAYVLTGVRAVRPVLLSLPLMLSTNHTACSTEPPPGPALPE